MRRPIRASILPGSLWAVAIEAEVSQSLQTQAKQGVTRMLGVVATIKIKDGKGADFEKVAIELVKKVNENEKGCLLYQLIMAKCRTLMFSWSATLIRLRSKHIAPQSISRHSAGRWANSWMASQPSSASSRSGLSRKLAKAIAPLA